MGGWSGGGGVGSDTVLLLDGSNSMTGAIKTSNRQIEGAIVASPDDDFPGTDLNTNLWTEIDAASGNIAAVVSGGYCKLSSTAGINTTGAVANKALKSNWTCATDYDVRVIIDVSSGRWNASNLNIGLAMNHETTPTDAQLTGADRADVVTASCNVDSSISQNQFGFWYDASQVFSNQTALDWIALRLVRTGNVFQAFQKNAATLGAIGDISLDTGWTQIGSDQTFTPSQAAGRCCIMAAGGAGGAEYDLHDFAGVTGTFSGAPNTGPLLEIIGTGEVASFSPVFDVYDSTKSAARKVMSVYKDADSDICLIAGGASLDDGSGILCADGYDTGGSVYRPGMARLMDVDGDHSYVWGGPDGELRLLNASKPSTFATDGRSIGPMAYGGMYTDAGAGSQTISSGTPAKITQFTGNMSSFGTTPDHATDDDITVLRPGFYLVGFHIGFTGSASTVWDIHVRKGGTEVAYIAAQRKIGTVGTDVGSCSACGIISLADNDVLTLYAEPDGASKDIDIVEAQFYAVQIA